MAKQYSTTRGNLAYKGSASAAGAPRRKISQYELERQRRQERQERLERQQERARRSRQAKAYKQELRKIRVREQQPIAPVSVAGMVLVAVMAVSVIMGYVQLNAVNEQVVEVSRQLTTLQQDEQSLNAAFEQTFDMQSIELGMLANGTMVKPDSSQEIYLTMEEPDSATVFTEEEQGMLSWLRSRMSRLVEYFS